VQGAVKDVHRALADTKALQVRGWGGRRAKALAHTAGCLCVTMLCHRENCKSWGLPANLGLPASTMVSTLEHIMRFTSMLMCCGPEPCTLKLPP
jgi:hypothetical protein